MKKDRLKEFLWGVMMLIFLCVLLSFFDEVEADDSGMYWGIDMGYLNVADDDWDSNGGIPTRLFVGYRTHKFKAFWGPRIRFNWMHLSNFEGGITNDLWDTDPESDLDFYSIGACWGAC